MECPVMDFNIHCCALVRHHSVFTGGSHLVCIFIIGTIYGQFCFSYAVVVNPVRHIKLFIQLCVLCCDVFRLFQSLCDVFHTSSERHIVCHKLTNDSVYRRF